MWSLPNLYTMWIITVKYHIWVAVSITILTTYNSIANKLINALYSYEVKNKLHVATYAHSMDLCILAIVIRTYVASY